MDRLLAWGEDLSGLPHRNCLTIAPKVDHAQEQTANPYHRQRRRALPPSSPNKKTFDWDDEVRGLGCYRTSGGDVIFVYQYRMPYMPARRARIGMWGEMTPAQAREIAREWAVMRREDVDPIEDRRKVVREEKAARDLVISTYGRRPHGRGKRSAGPRIGWETFVITQDLSSLDWGRWYSDRTKWPVDRNILLADSVLRIARMMVFPWHDEFVLAASAAAAPLLPGPIDAFRPDGTPVDEVHRAWGPTLLRYMSVDEYEAAAAVRDDPAAWARLYEPDPEGGPPRPRHTDREDGLPRISVQHWDQAAWQAAEIESFREAGCRALPHIAREMARMAVEESLSFVARPIGGGEPVDLEPDDWLVDDPAARVASCTMNIDQRRSTVAAASKRGVKAADYAACAVG